jgi:DNA repair exonuclease SbcCD ATPase subunit
MTPSQYFTARVAQGFGIQRRNKRLTEASQEMHLLRDAELFLGQLVWESVADVEELGVEYWNLRKLINEREEIVQRLEICRDTLDKAQGERAALLNLDSTPQQDIIEERSQLITNLESHARKRDDIVARARRVRRNYDGLITKLEVLGQSPELNTAVIRESQERLEELKKQFSDLKNERVEIAELIQVGDDRLDEIEGIMAEFRNKRRLGAAEAFHVIGDANREISTHRAGLGLMETQMRQLYAEIGRYVSRNIHTHAEVAKAAAEHRPLIEVMRALRRSVAYNHRLTGQV